MPRVGEGLSVNFQCGNQKTQVLNATCCRLRRPCFVANGTGLAHLKALDTKSGHQSDFLRQQKAGEGLYDKQLERVAERIYVPTWFWWDGR